MAGYRANILRVDSAHADAFTAWRAMGSPAHPSADQIRALDRAALLKREPVPIRAGSVDFDLPRQGVALVEFESPTRR